MFTKLNTYMYNQGTLAQCNEIITQEGYLAWENVPIVKSH